MMIQGYQYDLKRKLVPVEENHLEGNLLPSFEKYNLYATKDGVFVGQIIWMPWQDGSALVYSGRFGPPRKIFQPYFKAINQEDGLMLPGMEGGSHFMTSVIPLSKEKFKEVSERIKGAVIAKYYKGDEPDIKDFPDTLEKYEKLMEKQK